MKTFKKLLAMLLALAMVFAMAACELNSSDDDDDDKKSKEEKFLSELEDLLDEILEAIEDGDQEKEEELYEKLEDMGDEYEDILEELEEDDEEKAEDFEKDFEKLIEKFEEDVEELENEANNGGDFEIGRPQREEAVTDTRAPDAWDEPAPTETYPVVEEMYVADITGEWRYTIDISAGFGAGIDQGAGMEIAPYEELYVTLVYEFDSNGKYELSTMVDEDSAEDYYEALIDNMIDMMKDRMDENGVSMADFESEYGMDLETYCDTYMESYWETALLAFDTSATGYYEVDGDTIYIAKYRSNLGSNDNYMEFYLNGNTLTITKSVENGQDMGESAGTMGMDLPWTFKKQ